jgi:flagellar hook-associated protein 2
VTLNLLTAKQGTKINLTIAADTNGATNRIKAFVATYNTLKGQLSSLGGYNATSKAAGPMLGDSLLTGIDDQLRRTLSAPVQGAGQLTTLASIGITTQTDGTLAVDDTKLQKALTTNFDSVGKLFGSTTGVGANLYSQVDQRLSTTGSLESRSNNLTAQQKDLTNRQSDVDERMTNLLAGYVKQFTSLDTLLSSLQTTSAYLTQQLSSLPMPNSTSSRSG